MTTRRIDGRDQVYRKPSAMASKTLVWARGAIVCIGRAMTTASTTGTNVIAFARKAAPMPNSDRANAPTMGPIAREAWNCTEFSRTAVTRCSRGTRVGTNDCHAAICMPEMMPVQNNSPSTRHGVSRSAL
ncbi:unannotated protein [freshwater metagenome]|uniref:Unannotated protein n=1 Tax=freshwater metagenome TaxID=449393 RepID=A0A6J7Q9Q3_9ZZZZ